MDPNRPCHHCPDRYPACQDVCTKPEKLAFDEKHRKMREGAARYSENIRSAVESRIRQHTQQKRGRKR